MIAAVLVGVDLMFFFWPFRYRQVQPLLEQVFRSRVSVQEYHRTYFPHPGFVAEGVTFYRHGDTAIPPLARVKRMQVIGTWTTLLFHPHLLYQIRLEGLHVQIPPSGTNARGMDFDQGVIDTSQSKLQIETIVADGTTLDFLRGRENPPLQFRFARLRIHNVRAGQPFQFVTRVMIPGPQGAVDANGSLGPLRTNDYGSTPLSGIYALTGADLSRVDHVAGHVAARGRFRGPFSAVDVEGQADIPDFRAGSAHQVRLDAHYRVVVNGTNGDVQIEKAVVQSGGSAISASGSVTGSPKKVAVNLAANRSQVADLLRMVEQGEPQVEGTVSFEAAAEFEPGPERFLQRLKLTGTIALDGVRFTRAKTEESLDAFSARVQRSPPGDTKSDPRLAAKDDPPEVSADARSDTRFANGMAYFPDIRVTFPGARARLHGSFNLLDTRIHLTGQIALQQGISHAATGWKALLLKPLTPFFRHRRAGAVVPIAVTGTAQDPKVGADLLHDK
ncbi:MAG: AsmA-like C-terminal region-containing protein [Acidobacteriaceae bacterium]